MQTHGRGNKIEIFSKYKFCIAMENSVGPDYVTEKLYQAYTAGCVPIFLGAPNIEDFQVHADSVVDYQKLGGTPEALYAEVLRLNSDDEAYANLLAWKTMPVDELSPSFLNLLIGNLDQHTQCKLCRKVIDQRIQPTNLTGTHCLRNETWLAKFDNSLFPWRRNQSLGVGALQSLPAPGP